VKFLPLVFSLVLPLAAVEKPNVLFIFADDMTHAAVGALGHPEVKTPNLDKLFASGTTFTHAYNPGGWNGAICVASRNMLMTGRRLWFAKKEEPQLKKEVVPAGKTWPQIMKKAGYTTYMTGKWHVRADAGSMFDHVGDVRPGMPNQVKEGYLRPVKGQPDKWDPADPKHGGFWKGGKHWSEVEADTAVKFLAQAKKDTKPFFFYLSFNAPHDPRQAPQKYLDMYPAEKVGVPANFLPEYPHNKVMKAPHGLRDEKLIPMPRTPYAVQVNRREYFAIITHLDAQIGRVLDALDANGQRENTLIVFTADHGLSVGRHGLVGKQNMYDHSIRVPYVISGLDIEKGKKITSPIYLQDSIPTILEMTNVGVPKHIQFDSFVPVLEGKSKGHTQIYSAYVDSQRAFTKDGYKLILYPGGKIARLFNLKKDPLESVDLLENGKGKKKAKELLAALKAEAKEWGDTLELGEYPNLK
jgi:choline-sulfatase